MEMQVSPLFDLVFNSYLELLAVAAAATDRSAREYGWSCSQVKRLTCIVGHLRGFVLRVAFFFGRKDIFKTTHSP